MRPIDRPNMCVRQFSREGNGNAAATCPNIEDTWGGYPGRCQQAYGRLNKDFRIGTRNKHAGVDLELQRPEFLAAGDVGYRLALGPADHALLEVGFLRIGNPLLKSAVQARLADVKRMCQQDFRVQARRVYIGRLEPMLGPGHKLGDRLGTG